jgi:ferritin-like protein
MSSFYYIYSNNHCPVFSTKIHIELGGKPTTDVMKASTCGFSEPPENYSDLTRVIELVLEGERCAIEKWLIVRRKPDLHRV